MKYNSQFFIPLLLFDEDRWLEAFSMDDVDEFEEDEEFVEGDERDDMAEDKLVGETDDFF